MNYPLANDDSYSMIQRLSFVGGASTDALKTPVAKEVWRVEIARLATVFSSQLSDFW